jgi:hypothetical protein
MKKLTRKQFLKTCAGAALTGATGSGAQATPQGRQPSLPERLELATTLHPTLKTVRAVCWDADGRLCVGGEGGVLVYDAALKESQRWPAEGEVCALAADPKGGVWAAGRSRIERFDADGKRLAAWGELGVEPGQLRYVTALAPAGAFLYVADAGARCIHRFAENGDYVDAIEGFKIPSGYFDCQCDAQGILHVTHTGRHQVERYDAGGRLLDAWGRFGPGAADFCGCCNPTNLALMPEGRIATTEKGAPRLKVYAADGSLVAMLDERNFPGNSAGMALAVDKTGHIALVEPVRGEARVYHLAAGPGSDTA